MTDWLSQSIGAIGAAFGGDTTTSYSPPAQPSFFNPNTSGQYVQESYRQPTFGKRWDYSNYGTYDNPMDRYATNAAAQINEIMGKYTNASGSTGGNGTVGSFSDSNLSILNNFNSFFQQAGSATGLDPNLIKSIAAMEQGWTADGGFATSPAGAIGFMQVMPNGYLELQKKYPNWKTDPLQNIMLGAEILKDKIAANGGNIQAGVEGYLGSGVDPYTGVSTGEYWNQVNQYWQQLNANGGSFSGGGQTADQAISYIFGANAKVESWGEFGAESGNGLYGYGADYGMSGTQHTGVDVPLALNSQFRAPMGGTVMCGGTGVGVDAGGGTCSAFNDYYGNRAGRVEVLLDNGVTLIFGHSSQSFVKPGQRVNAGDLLGLSGGMNSPHIHLEARIRDSSLASGWRIVDPRQYLGGMSGGTGGAGTGATQPQPNRPWWMDMDFITGGSR